MMDTRLRVALTEKMYDEFERRRTESKISSKSEFAKLIIERYLGQLKSQIANLDNPNPQANKAHEETTLNEQEIRDKVQALKSQLREIAIRIGSEKYDAFSYVAFKVLGLQNRSDKIDAVMQTVRTHLKSKGETVIIPVSGGEMRPVALDDQTLDMIHLSAHLNNRIGGFCQEKSNNR